MDSYFGQIGHSFYGGPNGLSFSVRETFSNKVALDEDKNRGLSSSILIGEYVIVSYGNPHAAPITPTTRNYSSYSSFPSTGEEGVFYKDTSTGNVYCWGRESNLDPYGYILINSTGTEYYYNKVIDYYSRDGLTYNATLWQKIFLSEVAYKLILSFETNTPEFIFLTSVQDPGVFNPAINNITDISTSEITKIFLLAIPDVWDIVKGLVVESNPGDDDNIVIAVNRYPLNDGLNESDVYKYVHFTLPKPWGIEITRGDMLDADADPVLTPTDIENVETKKWLLDLPSVWNILLGGLTAVNPISDPMVVINNTTPGGETDHNSKYVYFSLPKPWNIGLGSDSGWVNPVEFASVAINQIPGSSGVESDTTKYLHIMIPNAWNIIKASDNVVVNPDVSPDVVIDRYATSNSGSESDTTKYVHFKLPKAWNFALGKVELVLPNANPEVVLNTENASGVTSVDTKYLHFKLPVALEFTTDAFTIELLGPTEAARVVTWFLGSDTNHRYPKVELSLPRAEKTKYGSAMAYTSNTIINNTGSTAMDWQAILELSVGDIYINTVYAAVHKIVTKTSSLATTEYLGSMQLAVPNIQANGINPYDANGNPVVPTITTSAVGPVATWTVNVDTIKAPVFKKSADSGFVASTATGVISSVAANDGITYTIKVPRGARINTSTDAMISLIVNPFDGDINIDENGVLRQYNGSLGRWDSKANLHGNSFLIKNPSIITITASDLTNVSGSDIYLKMGNYISDPEQGFPVAYYDGLKENEILNIDYLPEAGVSLSHWLYKSNNRWVGSLLTGSISNAIVENTWQDFAEDDKAYSVTRINELRTAIIDLLTSIANINAAINAAWGELPITG